MLLAVASWERLPMFELVGSGRGETFIHIWLKHCLDVGYKSVLHEKMLN